MMKTSLVIVKALIVFMLGSVVNKSVEFELWEVVVTAMFFASLIVLALMTFAFSIRNVWKNPSILAAAGVAHPRAFMIQYALCYMSTKVATIFLMAQGYVPAWFECSPRQVRLQSSRSDGTDLGASINVLDSQICAPCDSRQHEHFDNGSWVEGGGPSTIIDERNGLLCAVGAQTPVNSTFYGCEVSCTEVYFAAQHEQASGRNLIFAVMAPLAWLPFAVYHLLPIPLS